jgi:hypothetical protein
MERHRERDPGYRRRAKLVSFAFAAGLVLTACAEGIPDYDVYGPDKTVEALPSPGELAKAVLNQKVDCKRLPDSSVLIRQLQRAGIVVVDGECDDRPDDTVLLYYGPKQDPEGVVFEAHTGDTLEVYCAGATLIAPEERTNWIPTAVGFVPAGAVHGTADCQ